MESARETVPAIPRDTIAELRHSLQQLKEEKELSEQKWMEERTSLEQEHKRTIERLESQVSELNGELRGRVNGEEMARLKNALVTLQRVGVPVNYREDSDIPVPDTERVLLGKLQHLETSNSELRSTFNDIYNKYMTSENERHTAEEKLSDAREQIRRMELQIGELEQRTIAGAATPGMNMEAILKDQRDRYKRRVDELEVGV